MDAQEFDDFYAASFRKVTGQVYAMIGDLDEAGECVQEAFARAWAHRRTFGRVEHPPISPWRRSPPRSVHRKERSRPG